MSHLVIHRNEGTATRGRVLPILGAMIATAIALHLIVTRPILHRVEVMTAELQQARAELAGVAGSRTDAWRTNDLLTALTIQAERVADAETALGRFNALAAKVDELDGRIAGVDRRTDAAFGVVDRFDTLHDRIAAAAGSADAVQRDLDDLSDVSDRIDALANVAPMHEEALDEMHMRIGELSGLASDMLVHEDVIDRAGKRVNDVLAMSAQLAGTDTQTAAANAAALVAVAGDLNTVGGEVIAPARRVIGNLETATAGLETQGERLSMLIESAEVIRDFETELAVHVRGLEGVRRQLLDFAMLEGAVNRVAGMMGPLRDIARVHAIDADDLQQVVNSMRGESPREMVADSEPATQTAELTVPEPLALPVLR